MVVSFATGGHGFLANLSIWYDLIAYGLPIQTCSNSKSLSIHTIRFAKEDYQVLVLRCLLPAFKFKHQFLQKVQATERHRLLVNQFIRPNSLVQGTKLILQAKSELRCWRRPKGMGKHWPSWENICNMVHWKCFHTTCATHAVLIRWEICCGLVLLPQPQQLRSYTESWRNLKMIPSSTNSWEVFQDLHNQIFTRTARVFFQSASHITSIWCCNTSTCWPQSVWKYLGQMGNLLRQRVENTCSMPDISTGTNKIILQIPSVPKHHLGIYRDVQVFVVPSDVQICNLTSSKPWSLSRRSRCSPSPTLSCGASSQLTRLCLDAFDDGILVMTSFCLKLLRLSACFGFQSLKTQKFWWNYDMYLAIYSQSWYVTNKLTHI